MAFSVKKISLLWKKQNLSKFPNEKSGHWKNGNPIFKNYFFDFFWRFFEKRVVTKFFIGDWLIGAKKWWNGPYRISTSPYKTETWHFLRFFIFFNLFCACGNVASQGKWLFSKTKTFFETFLRLRQRHEPREMVVFTKNFRKYKY